MANYDIPLHMVTEGMILFLGDDLLLISEETLGYFCEPGRVEAVHYDLPEGCDMPIISARGTGGDMERGCYLEFLTSAGESVLIVFPDDRHIVAGINLPKDVTLLLPDAGGDPANRWWAWLRKGLI